MRKIAENIYEHNGIKAKKEYINNLMPPVCSGCPWQKQCGLEFDCQEHIGNSHVFVEIKENSMKKSELSFKCVLGSPARNKKMYDAIIQAGIKNCIREEDFVKSAMCLRIDDTWNNEVSPTYASKITESYESAPIPEVSFETALKMLESIEPDAPEFDIKLRDDVLCRDDDRNTWEIRNFARSAKPYAFMTYGYFYRQMIKYAGNEHLHGTADTPDGWWECVDGKPVWKTK